jgi:hypothetical protein
MSSWTAIDESEGCLCDRGLPGAPRSSLNDCRCCEAALGICDIRSDGFLLGGVCVSFAEGGREESEDPAGETWFRFGDAMAAVRSMSASVPAC